MAFRFRRAENLVFVFRVVALPLAVAGCTGGCGPELKDEIPEDAAERYATAFCEAMFDCDACLVRTGYTSEDECRSEVQAGYERAFDQLGDKGDFEVGCLDSLVRQYEEGKACDLSPLAISGCALLTGSQESGEACESPAGSPLARVSTCSPALHCLEGVCRTIPVEVTDTAGIGDDCGAPVGCEGDLRCSDGTCIVAVGEGDACAANQNQCDSDLYCSSEDVCASKVPPGEACDHEGSTSACDGVSEGGWGLASWCVSETCSGAQPLICSSEE